MKNLKSVSVSIGVTVLTVLLCMPLSEAISYKIIALILLMMVSVLAMIFDITAVLIAAVLSAILWNFLFIPPKYTLYISDPEDFFLFLMYFIVASVNGVLNFKIRMFKEALYKKEEVERSNKLYNTLISSLSHELKTPLSTIIGNADLLIDYNEKIEPERKNDLLTGIQEAGLKLNYFINNLLNISRIESNTVKPKLIWCDINEMIVFTINKTIGNEGGKTINFIPNNELPLAKIDRGLTEICIYNIISNSLQVTTEQVEISVTAEGYKTGIKINVTDSGPGFPEDELPKVFDKFYRLKNSAYRSTGLGLSIVKGFIDAQKGTVTIKNNVVGCTVSIFIPCEFTKSRIDENE